MSFVVLKGVVECKESLGFYGKIWSCDFSLWTKNEVYVDEGFPPLPPFNPPSAFACMILPLKLNFSKASSSFILLSFFAVVLPSSQNGASWSQFPFLEQKILFIFWHRNDALFFLLNSPFLALVNLVVNPGQILNATCLNHFCTWFIGCSIG